MEIIEFLCEEIGNPISQAIDQVCDDPDMASLLKIKVGATASLSLWKSYSNYIKSSNERNRKLTEDSDTVKLCWN